MGPPCTEVQACLFTLARPPQELAPAATQVDGTYKDVLRTVESRTAGMDGLVANTLVGTAVIAVSATASLQ